MRRSECPWRLYVLVSASSFSSAVAISRCLFIFFAFLKTPLLFGQFLEHFDNSSPPSHPRLFRRYHRRLGHSFPQLRPWSTPFLILRIGNCHRLATRVRIPDRSTPFLVTAWCILRRWGSHRSPSDFNIPVIEIACLC